MRHFWRERGMELIPPRIGCRALALAARQGVRQLVVAKETVPVATAVRPHTLAAFRPLN